MIYRLSDKLNFGKHKGDTIADVIKISPSYLEWAIETIEWFELSDTAKRKLEKQLEIDCLDYLDADEYTHLEAYDTFRFGKND